MKTHLSSVSNRQTDRECERVEGRPRQQRPRQRHNAGCCTAAKIYTATLRHHTGFSTAHSRPQSSHRRGLCVCVCVCVSKMLDFHDSIGANVFWKLNNSWLLPTCKFLFRFLYFVILTEKDAANIDNNVQKVCQFHFIFKKITLYKYGHKQKQARYSIRN